MCMCVLHLHRRGQLRLTHIMMTALVTWLLSVLYQMVLLGCGGANFTLIDGT